MHLGACHYFCTFVLNLVEFFNLNLVQCTVGQWLTTLTAYTKYQALIRTNILCFGEQIALNWLSYKCSKYVDSKTDLESARCQMPRCDIVWFCTYETFITITLHKVEYRNTWGCQYMINICMDWLFVDWILLFSQVESWLERLHDRRVSVSSFFAQALSLLSRWDTPPYDAQWL